MKDVVVSSDQARLIHLAEKIVSPLIHEGMFEDFERAFRALLLDYVDRHIAIYKDKNAEFEARYQQNFDSFTASLKNRATPAQEDEWMDWESAVLFLAKWQFIRGQVVEQAVKDDAD